MCIWFSVSDNNVYFFYASTAVTITVTVTIINIIIFLVLSLSLRIVVLNCLALFPLQNCNHSFFLSLSLSIFPCFSVSRSFCFWNNVHAVPSGGPLLVYFYDKFYPLSPSLIAYHSTHTNDSTNSFPICVLRRAFIFIAYRCIHCMYQQQAPPTIFTSWTQF